MPEPPRLRRTVPLPATMIPENGKAVNTCDQCGKHERPEDEPVIVCVPSTTDPAGNEHTDTRIKGNEQTCTAAYIKNPHINNNGASNDLCYRFRILQYGRADDVKAQSRCSACRG